MVSTKVCVTGGSGFIGQELVNKLVALGYSVIVPTRVKSRIQCSTPQVQYLCLDFLDPLANLQECLDGCKVVFNCAGEIKNSRQMHALHVDATQRLLDVFVAQSKAMGFRGRWVQLSSVGAYGPAHPANLKRVIDEATELAPIGDYEISKTLADQILLRSAADNAEALAFTILRPSNVCGSSMPNGALREWAAAIKKGLFTFIGPKDAISTYVHVKDVVDAMILCAFDERAENQIFNISNDCLQTDLVRAMANAVDAPYPSRRIPEYLARFAARAFSHFSKFPLKESRVDALVARTKYPADKLETSLGFVPKIHIPTSINEIVKH